MKISVQTGGAIDAIGIENGFSAIAAAGFDAVDISFDSGRPWEEIKSGSKNPFFDDENIYPYLDNIKAAAKEHGISFGQAHAPAPLFIKDSEKASENIKNDVRKSIALCEYIGCPRLIIHPIFDGSARFPHFTKEEEYKVNMEFFSSLIPLFKKHNVICCLENMWIQDWKTKKIYEGCCSNADEVVRYIDDLNAIAGEKRFGFCLDIGHLLLIGKDPCAFIEKLGHRIEALHVHDNDGIHDNHTAPYLGCCNWDRVIRGLRKIGYTGSFNFETAGFNQKFPNELVPSALNMLGDIGRYLIRRITAEKGYSHRKK